MAKVSFSQFSMWSGCPHQYKLNYIDGLSESSSNIHAIFGSAMHEILQEYLNICLTESKAKGDKTDLKESLKDKMRQIYLKESNNGVSPICTKEELVEFLNDGNTILDYFQKSKNFNQFFSLKDDELIAIEQPLNTEVRPGIRFVGFIDMIVRSKWSGKYRIIDFKTSTSGWSKYQKKDPVKNSQILLYKKFYAEMLGISQDMIDVEFIILKRKVSETTDFKIPRISRHVPANGKPSINKAWNEFDSFLNNVFDAEGNYRIDAPFNKIPNSFMPIVNAYFDNCFPKSN